MREQNQLYEKILFARGSYASLASCWESELSSDAESCSDPHLVHDFAFSSLMNKLVAGYSLGEDIDSLREIFMIACGHYSQSGDIGVNDYSHHLSMFSLAILFEIPSDLFNELEKVWTRRSKTLIAGGDYLIDSIIASRIDGYRPREHFVIPKMYGSLRDVMEEADTKEAESKIAAYLKKWYQGLRASGSLCYASHKEKSNFLFIGYWSFEAAAIAKIKRLSITQKYGEYFPYSLFGLDETPPKKHNIVKPMKTWQKLVFGYPAALSINVPGSWQKLASRGLQVVSPGEVVVLNASVYGANGNTFDQFCRVLLASKAKDMPWNRKVDHRERRLLRDDGVEVLHIVTEWEGVWPNEEGLTTYLSSCVEIEGLFINISFVGSSSEIEKAREDIKDILASVKPVDLGKN